MHSKAFDAESVKEFVPWIWENTKDKLPLVSKQETTYAGLKCQELVFKAGNVKITVMISKNGIQAFSFSNDDKGIQDAENIMHLE